MARKTRGHKKAGKKSGSHVGTKRKRVVKNASPVKSWPQEAKPVKAVRTFIPLSDIGFDDANQREAGTGGGGKAAEISGLAATIAAHGLLQPIRVRVNPAAGDGTKKGKGAKAYTVIFGHRRVLACRELGWERIEADVCDGDVPEQWVEERAIENIQRADLTSVEQGIAIAQMLAGAPHHITPESTPEQRTAAVAAIAERIGKSVTWVRERDMLSRLAPKVQAMVTRGELSLGRAVLIARIADPRSQEHLAREASTDTSDDRCSLEQLREWVNQEQVLLAKVPWDLAADRVAGMPACSSCPHNSVNNPSLFLDGDRGVDPTAAVTDPKGNAYCLNPGCFDKKRRWTDDRIAKAATRAVDAVQDGFACKKGAVPVALTVKGLQDHGLIPDRVNAEAFTAIVKSTVKAEEKPEVKPAAGRGTKLHQGERKPPQKSVAEEVNERWVERARTWMNQATELLKQAVLAVPGRRAMLELIVESNVGTPYHQYYSGARTSKEIEQQEKAWNAPRLLAAFASVKAPTLEGIVALEADMHQESRIQGIPGHEAGVAALARALEIQVPERPTYDAINAEVQSERAKAKQDAETAAAKADAAATGEKPSNETKKTTRDVAHKRKKSRAEAERELDQAASRIGEVYAGEGEPAAAKASN